MPVNMASRNISFLEFPLEVRLEIYRLALPRSEYREDLQIPDCPITWSLGICAGLLFANKQVQRESSEVLYKESYFALYIKHPRNPRLTYNESRADSQSFILISWTHRHWAHPRNPRIPWPALQKHKNLQDIRKWYVSVPELDDLIGVDAYMRRASIAGLYGINIWVANRARNGGCLTDDEKERMAYLQKYKDPINEAGIMLRSLPRIDVLSLGLGYGNHNVTCREYVLNEILLRRGVGQAKCFYTGTTKEGNGINHGLVEGYRQMLQSNQASANRERLHMPRETESMHHLLQAIRTRQVLEPPMDPVDLIRD
ncbi:MAG: hypothetical protein Q9163_004380 [Psora crenata]